MLKKIPADRRHFADHGWLKTHYLFSFADYHDPRNVNFGTLRVFNDDVIDGYSGFGEHDHADMEIVTIVLSGELSHSDNMGNKGTIRAGEVQYMSAGSGVSHSEVNLSADPVHLYQVWILPGVESTAPHYAQRNCSGEMQTPGLLALASGQDRPQALRMRTDATIYHGFLPEAEQCSHLLEQGRGAFVYVSGGDITINEQRFHGGDQARIWGEPSLTIQATREARFILIDVPLPLQAASAAKNRHRHWSLAAKD